MAVDEARRFLEEFKPGSELGEAIKAGERGADETPLQFYARMAADRGFDFSAAELEAAYAELQGKDRDAVDSAELSDDELEQLSVAGGWCWFDDLCSKTINYERENPTCKWTWKEGEECTMLDDCDLASNHYYCTVGSWREINN